MFFKIITLFFCIYKLGFSQDVQENFNNRGENLIHGEKTISENIVKFLEIFKQPNPLPEPYSVPDMKQTVAYGTILCFKNTTVYGIGKLRILHVNAEIGALEAEAVMAIEKIQARGNYTLSTWLKRTQGLFTVNLTGLLIKARANLGVERDGKIRAQDIKVDLSFNTTAVNFVNLGFFESMFQGVINSVGTFIFNTIKPYVLKEAYFEARTVINTKLDKVVGNMQFPNSISPLDIAIADTRKKIREMKLDPYKVDDYNTTMGKFSVKLSHTWVTGLSSFQRVSNITLELIQKRIVAEFRVSTEKLEGMTQWEIIPVSELTSRAGTASFSVEYMNWGLIIDQHLDTEAPPELTNIDLKLGNIQVHCDGAGILDDVIELVVEMLPDLLEYQILDTLDITIKDKIDLEVYKIVNSKKTNKQELPRLDEMQNKVSNDLA